MSPVSTLVVPLDVFNHVVLPFLTLEELYKCRSLSSATMTRFLMLRDLSGESLSLAIGYNDPILLPANVDKYAGQLSNILCACIGTSAWNLYSHMLERCTLSDISDDEHCDLLDKYNIPEYLWDRLEQVLDKFGEDSFTNESIDNITSLAILPKIRMSRFGFCVYSFFKSFECYLPKQEKNQVPKVQQPHYITLLNNAIHIPITRLERIIILIGFRKRYWDYKWIEGCRGRYHLPIILLLIEHKLMTGKDLEDLSIDLFESLYLDKQLVCDVLLSFIQHCIDTHNKEPIQHLFLYIEKHYVQAGTKVRTHRAYEKGRILNIIKIPNRPMRY